MAIWNIIENDIVINSIVAESIEVAQEFNPGKTVIESDGIVGIGWSKESGSWIAPYPTSGLEYSWNEELFRWELVPSPLEEPIVE